MLVIYTPPGGTRQTFSATDLVLSALRSNPSDRLAGIGASNISM